MSFEKQVSRLRIGDVRENWDEGFNRAILECISCCREADARIKELEAALAELLRVDDEWHGSVNSEMANARSMARKALTNDK